MTQRMAAPSTVSPGSKVFYPDGTSDSVGATGSVNVPDIFVGALLNAGFQLGQSTSPTVPIGYGVGAGGAVTQQSSKATGVTLNKVTGQITMNGAALGAAAEATFTVTNAVVALGDIVVVNHVSAGTSGAYNVGASNVVAGAFDITVTNWSAGSLSEAIVIEFAVFRGSAS